MDKSEKKATLSCVCKPDCCLGEGDPPNQCRLCATMDGELPCPVADAGEWPDAEARELAGRMALDEAAEGDFAAAAELKSFADGEPVVGVALEGIPAGGEGRMIVGVDPRIQKMLAEDAATNPRPLPSIARHIPVTAEQLGWASSADLRAEIQAAVDKLGGAGYRVPEPPLVSRNAVIQALAADLRRLIPQVTGAKLHSDHNTALAGALIEAGWVPSARRRATKLDIVDSVLAKGQVQAADDRYEEVPVLDEDGETVIGHVWEVQPRYALTHPREWVAAIDKNVKNRPRFGSFEGAVDWVRARAPRDGRPLTVPYDAEKVLGLKNAVIGWVWLDPEHAGGDSRWLAVHGSHPEHRHPLFGSSGPGLDARNQAIGWVLEQDKEARR